MGLHHNGLLEEKAKAMTPEQDIGALLQKLCAGCGVAMTHPPPAAPTGEQVEQARQRLQVYVADGTPGTLEQRVADIRILLAATDPKPPQQGSAESEQEPKLIWFIERKIAGQFTGEWFSWRLRTRWEAIENGDGWEVVWTRDPNAAVKFYTDAQAHLLGSILFHASRAIHGCEDDYGLTKHEFVDAAPPATKSQPAQEERAARHAQVLMHGVFPYSNVWPAEDQTAAVAWLRSLASSAGAAQPAQPGQKLPGEG